MKDDEDTFADQIMLIGGVIFLALNFWTAKD